MRIDLTRVTAAIGAISVTACGGQSGSIPGSVVRGPTYVTQASGSRPESLLTGGVPAQAQETVLHSFGNGSGIAPEPLTVVSGALYGTAGKAEPRLSGVVYKMTTSGVETVLHRFGGGSDGFAPDSKLTDVDGVFYGTTFNGGANGEGTVFKITTSGAETVLHSFGDRGDGDAPGDLTDVNGVLYGTTQGGGGANSCGTVYKITTSGEESVLYKFPTIPPHAECQEPNGLTNVNGVLYGTTQSGGDGACYLGCGTVFTITTSGEESVLYSFQGGSDSGSPHAGLTNVNGVLYGTTGGTVFKITTSGAESVLYSGFNGGNDGEEPNSPLVNVNGVLYGTTLLGGNGGGSPWNGTVFRVTMSGSESVVHSFTGGTADGTAPNGLVNLNGVLYGTTVWGGANDDGIAYSLSL